MVHIWTLLQRTTMDPGSSKSAEKGLLRSMTSILELPATPRAPACCRDLCFTAQKWFCQKKRTEGRSQVRWEQRASLPSKKATRIASGLTTWNNKATTLFFGWWFCKSSVSGWGIRTLQRLTSQLSQQWLDGVSSQDVSCDGCAIYGFWAIVYVVL